MPNIIINSCRRQHTNLDLGYLCLMPRPLCAPRYSQRDLDLWKFAITDQFYDVLLRNFTYLHICIHTPEGYSFSRKLYGINFRNLSTPPRTWYFLNWQRHDRWVSCANSERSVVLPLVLSRINFSEEIFCCQGKTTKIVLCT